MSDQKNRGPGGPGGEGFELESSGGGQIVDATTAVVTFASGNPTVSVSVSIPVNDPPLETLSVYGASNDSNPHTDPENKLQESAQRPSSGTMGASAAPAASGATYTVQLKFWYRGQPHSEDPTILTGSTSTSGTITLSST